MRPRRLIEPLISGALKGTAAITSGVKTSCTRLTGTPKSWLCTTNVTKVSELFGAARLALAVAIFGAVDMGDPVSSNSMRRFACDGGWLGRGAVLPPIVGLPWWGFGGSSGSETSQEFTDETLELGRVLAKSAGSR